MLRRNVRAKSIVIAFAFLHATSADAARVIKIQNIAGNYIFADGSAAHQYKCKIKLSLEKEGENYHLDIPPACRERLAVQSVSDWRFRPETNMIVFFSDGGSPILAFAENEELEAGSGGFYFDESLGDGKMGSRYIQQLAR